MNATVDYALSGKIFCGHCGAPMTGEFGKSKTGDLHYYYNCTNHKRHHTCKKRMERKNAIEAYVVEQTIQYALAPGNLDHIADAIIAEYEKEFNTDRIKECERRISAIDRELNNLVDTLA